MRTDHYYEIGFRTLEPRDSALLEKWYAMTDQFGYATGFKSFDEIRERIMPAENQYAIASMIMISGRNEAAGFIYGELKSLDRTTVLWIHIIIIDPAFQGKGLGTCVVNRLLHYAKSQGAIASVVSVSEQNKRGIRFWERLGFVRSAAMEGSIGAAGVAIMKRILS